MQSALRFGFLLAFLSAGCDAGGVTGRDGGMNDGAIPNACFAGGPAFACAGGEAIMCNADGTEGPRTNCTAMGQICAPGLGCRVCRPNSFQCNMNNVEQCNADGSAWTPVMTCDASAGQMCSAVLGDCRSACQDAADSNSYIGCEYYPVTTMNPVDPTFAFAVVIANPQGSEATITLTGPAGFSMNTTVAPNATQTIELPWNVNLKEGMGDILTPPGSVLERNGAYRLTSTLPVTVYQFSPLQYEDGGTYSYTNDASLLLPAHAMTGNYVVLSYPATVTREGSGFGGTTIGASPAFFAVVGTAETPTTVNIRFSADVAASNDGAVTAFSAGSSGTFMLNRGDVLQIITETPSTCNPSGPPEPNPNTGAPLEYCIPTPQTDLTGTEIRATSPVAVIGGHACAFVPHDKWACDHLEEGLFPLESWDNEAIVSITQALMNEPNIVRIVSGGDGNVLMFDPVPPGVTNGMTLNRAQVIEFEARETFRVTGSAAIMVGQFLVGQDYSDTGVVDGEGDPSFSLAIPTEQYRTDYTFLAPTTYTTHFVNVVAPGSASVNLDGNAVTGFTPIGGTGFSVARVPIEGGQHSISGSAPFGIVVYGFGRFTSYMYPGGLDLEEINPLI